jgi:hypothetical protein
MTSCKKGFNTLYNQVISQKCANTPVFWSDIYGDSCINFENEQYCNADGTYNTWNPDWGTFNEIGNPDKACCYCGGGIKFQTTEDYENCVCPEGSTDIGGVCIPTDPIAIITQKNTTLKEKCVDNSPTKDTYNRDCNFYADNKICDPNIADRKGENWNNTLFDSKLLENCCRCGGGEKTYETIPVYSVECPDISTLVDGKCVCPDISTLVDGKCVCPGESTLVDGKCVCPGGSTLVDGKCVCPGESSLVDGKCKCSTYRAIFANGKCICPKDYKKIGESCLYMPDNIPSDDRDCQISIFLLISAILLLGYLMLKTLCRRT